MYLSWDLILNRKVGALCLGRVVIVRWLCEIFVVANGEESWRVGEEACVYKHPHSPD